MYVNCDLQEQCSRSFIHTLILFLLGEKSDRFLGKEVTTARMFSLIKKDDVRTYPMRPNARTCMGGNTTTHVNKEIYIC